MGSWVIETAFACKSQVTNDLDKGSILMAVHDIYPALKSNADTAWVHIALDFKPQVSSYEAFEYCRTG